MSSPTAERQFRCSQEFKSFRPVAQDEGRPWYKPNGLWYSMGSEWDDWCEGNMPHQRERPYLYGVEVDLSRILLIDNAAKMREFHRKYSVFPRGVFDSIHISWEKVAEDYDGIEISPYFWEFRMEFDWYYTWDVASGCIWGKEAFQRAYLLQK